MYKTPWMPKPKFFLIQISFLMMALWPYEVSETAVPAEEVSVFSRSWKFNQSNYNSPMWICRVFQKNTSKSTLYPQLTCFSLPMLFFFFFFSLLHNSVTVFQ